MDIYHKVKFISQVTNYKRWAKISCGVASLKMVMDYMKCNNNINYYRMGILLRVNIERKYKCRSEILNQNEADVCGVYIEDVVDYCNLIGCSATTYNNHNFNKLVSCLRKNPVMIGINKGEYGHWGTALGTKEGSILYYDPDRKPDKSKIEHFSKSNMKEVWDGNFIVISKKNRLTSR